MRPSKKVASTRMEAMVLLLVLAVPLVKMAAVASTDGLPGCRTSCGLVDIPYPFGLSPNCSIGETFRVTCNKTEDGMMKPFLGNLEMKEIMTSSGQLRLLNHISSQCYNPTNQTIQPDNWWLSLAETLRLSDTLNKFTVIGCQTLAYILGEIRGSNNYQTGCVSMCENPGSLSNGSCAGIGCCQTSIPKGLSYYEVYFDSNFNTSSIYNFSQCSYAVLMEAGSFQFQTSYVTTDAFNTSSSKSRVPVVVDWAVGNMTCEEAQRNMSSFACKSKNSECFDSNNVHGYLCNCTSGYAGNAYLQNGCHDINECKNNPCTGLCRNLPGKHECYCPLGTYGNPVNGTCYPNQKLPLGVKLAIGASGSVAFLLFSGMCIYMIIQRKTIMNVKKQYFRAHGGWQLLEEIKGKQGLAFKIFTIDEIEKATNKFDTSRVLGRGGNGTVYRGILVDNSVVAIKKSKFIDESQKNEYGKEMLILSQINHKNIVKLLGCCLEVDVPILVYEFVSNGTLFQMIHEKRNNTSSFSLSARLRIAHESADALAYLHSSASPPIIHGDVKSSNILLGENHIAKVADFGASKLVPKDENQFATLVQGTCGYLDPEYLLTCQLTNKSDVYSFSVVLLELLTGKKAVYFEESEAERSLASSFILATKENRLIEIIDDQVKDEGGMELIHEISELAKQCLHICGEERPTMKEVAEELDKLRKFTLHPWEAHNKEEIESLLGEASSNHGMDITTRYNTDTMSALNIGYGR